MGSSFVEAQGASLSRTSPSLPPRLHLNGDKFKGLQQQRFQSKTYSMHAQADDLMAALAMNR